MEQVPGQGRVTPEGFKSWAARGQRVDQSRGGTSRDRNLNYAVTQDLGSFGFSFPAWPHPFKLALGSVSWGGGKEMGFLLPTPCISPTLPL